jgi:hypothetical protein
MKKMPTELIQDIKAAYPEWPELHKACDSNSNIVGRYLDDASNGSISPEEILRLIDGNHEELKRIANSLVRRKNVYVNWLNWYRSNHQLKHG